MRRALLLPLILAACGAPSTSGIKQSPAIPVADAGGQSSPPPDGGSVVPDAGRPFEDAGPCLAMGCLTDLCEPLADGGVACGEACDAPCTAAQLCQSSPCLSDAGWSPAFCTPSGATWAWSTSPACDAPADLCHTGDTCQAGACTGGTSPSCPVDACHGACVSSTGACAIHSGATCDDGNACTTGDTCASDGSCIGTATGTQIHRYSDAADCEWYFGNVPGTGWTDEGVVFRSAPGGTVTVQQLFNDDSLGRPLTTDPSPWLSMGFTVTEDDVVTAFSSSQPGSQKLVRYEFLAGSSCAVSGWTRYFSTSNPNESPPAGSSVSTTPPSSATNDTDFWLCPP